MTESENQNSASVSLDISQLTEHLFRHESGKLISVLTGLFGIERLQLAEDVVQEAMLRALHTWPYYGIPKNPPAWLTQTAKNIALDVIRREKTFRDKQQQIIATLEQVPDEPEPHFDAEIQDQRLRLMFACCHPCVPQEAQTALALKTLCGFSVIEISKAFLTSEAAIEKRLVRARQKIRESNVKFEIPGGKELRSRLDAVLQTLYLLFNEGYKASVGDKLIRLDLCTEAIRLIDLLRNNEAGNQPRTHALAALMYFNAARLSSRTDEDGNILRLKDQDRSKWDKKMIGQGMLAFGTSAKGDDLSTYHLQGAIAACHCAAPTYESTDWKRILSLYDQLLQLEDNAILRLNRAVALRQVQGPHAALESLKSISASLNDYYLLHAVSAEFLMDIGKVESAAVHLEEASRIATLPSEQKFLKARLEACRAIASPPT